MSHDLLGRDSCGIRVWCPLFHFGKGIDSTRRDRAGRWLWRLVRWIEHARKSGDQPHRAPAKAQVRWRGFHSTINQLGRATTRPNHPKYSFRSARPSYPRWPPAESPLPQSARIYECFVCLPQTAPDSTCRIGAEPPHVTDEPRPARARLVQHDGSLSAASFLVLFP